ncbi:hypothetical protein T08_9533 [Trichinella sp. T8]|uniref:Uncharacterized protein n=1 Tax=Trichinella murrelli TaxID=144512 RepID=A0A0V0T584_9BILA|nr:hypothetical protein T05_5945 [Trichinella murrelli]KRZ89468.1 hypothetical protein T08_9533 [Trichinella sp. T8]
MGTAQSCRKVVNQYHRDQGIRRKSWNSQTASSGITLSDRDARRRQYYEETASYQDHSRVTKCREREGLERSDS